MSQSKGNVVQHLDSVNGLGEIFHHQHFISNLTVRTEINVGVFAAGGFDLIQFNLFQSTFSGSCLFGFGSVGGEALNNGMIKFPGVMLFASRDHQIVQTTANRIMEILPNGKLIDKITTYDEYLESDEMARKRSVYTAVVTEDED